ncbi:Uma2 family endonuclease [Parasediminibacterium sp. JCM 36343]|uniref:Uma2 family endonuclease n=1 Tax=Parasediminibacterium sp. JCM 36343 TaxID=3374279 RepID=UPI00397CCB92
MVQPDICVVCDLAKLDKRGCIGAPDWIIEILSPGNTNKEMKDKYYLYEENGVKEYWIVYPEYYQVSVYDLINEKYVLRNSYHKGDAIPVSIFEGFTIDTDSLFE